MSGISLFDEPPRVSIKGIEGLRNGFLLGMVVIEAVTDGIVVVEDGSMVILPLSLLVLDWRYNPETDQWVDTSMVKADQMDVTT